MIVAASSEAAFSDAEKYWQMVFHQIHYSAGMQIFNESGIAVPE